MKKSILFFLLFLGLITSTNSQVTSLKYLIEYNESTSLFDCKIVILEGSAMTYPQRVQFNGQYSIVVPTGTQCILQETYNPLENNQSYTSTIPCLWDNVSPIIAPAAQPQNDFYSFYPNLSPVSAYNNLVAGDTVTLFSIYSDGDPCGNDIRPFINGIDPPSQDLNGADFSNGFSIGSIEQIYDGNLSSTYMGPWTVSLSDYEVCEGECIELTPYMECAPEDLTYSWSTGETSPTITVCPSAVTEYSVEISGPNSAMQTGLNTVSVFDPPIVSNLGSSEICISGSTNLSSSSGGTWTALHPAIASLVGTTVTGQSSGDAAFLFTSTATGCVSDTLWINVDSGPTTTLTGPNQICIGSTTTIEPSTGGTWSSSNPAIATIDNFGTITGVGSGVATFTYTSATTLCASDPSEPVNVFPAPIVNAPSTSLCLGETMTVTPGGGGTWVSSDPSVATVNAFSGLVTTISPGSVTFTFTFASTGCSATTDVVTVYPVPEVEFKGPDEICVGFTTAVSPTSGGTWTSQTPSVATIDNLGNITGISAGTADLIFTDINTGCVSAALTVTVLAATPVSITGDDELCITETSTLSPTTGGVWTSNTTLVATVTNAGVVTAVGPGQATFTFTSGTGQCTSTDTDPITVHGPESIVLNDDELCIGETTQLLPASGGTWVSANPSIASATSAGLVQGQSAGVTTFTFTSSTTGCSSEPTDPMTVHGYISTVITGEDVICITETSQMSPSTGGTWSSSDSGVATITNAGLVTGVSSGTATFTFTPTATGCPTLPSDPIMVEECSILAASCEEINPSNIFCDYAMLSQFEDSLKAENAQGDQPMGDLCENGAEASNIVWLGFFALEGDYEIQINSRNCNSANGVMPSGIQVGLYSSCDFDESNKVFCNVGNQLENTIRISSDILIPGNVYYMYIDGIDNATCDFNIEVEGDYNTSFCTDLSKVTGVAYIDTNANGVYDADEIPLRNVLISLSPGDLSVLTNDERKYIINTPKGGATLTAQAYEGGWEEDFLTLADVAILEVCVEDINFGFIPDLNAAPSASISVTNTIARCDWETKFYITVENTGALPFDGLLEFEFDDKATFFSSPISNLNVNGNKASVQTGELSPFTPREYQITLKMPSGSTVLPMLDFKAELKDMSDMQIAEYSYSDQLRCSYDPNDKREYPNRDGADNLTLMDEDIEYTIRFQNNGNDTAFLVKIVDELDPSIDPRSIRVVNSSHSVETCIEGNQLIFLFENINLVDSMTNYVASQGFVTFRSSTKTGRAEFTPVFNSADIIFDTNVPIITNNTINTLVSVLCTNVATSLDVKICEGEIYNGHEKSGVYTISHPLEYGCDSIVTINLEVQGITYSSQQIDICEGDSIILNGTTYSPIESQVIKDTISNAIGCITNVLSYDLEVMPILSIEIDTAICKGTEYNGLVESGIYTIGSFDPITGCDILTTIDLEVLPMSSPSCIVGVNEPIADEIKVYPNPAHEIISIESTSLIESVAFYTPHYQKINEIFYLDGVYQTQISIEDIPQGLHFIAIKSGGKIVYKKIIIK